MNSDLMLTDDGDVIFIQDRPFARTISRVEFFAETGTLILIYDNEDSRMVECEISDDDLIQAICEVPRIILTHTIDDKLQDGYDVPLIAIQ